MPEGHSSLLPDSRHTESVQNICTQPRKPLRTVTFLAQMMASWRLSGFLGLHQVITRRCLGENRMISAVVPRSFLPGGVRQHLPALDHIPVKFQFHASPLPFPSVSAVPAAWLWDTICAGGRRYVRFSALQAEQPAQQPPQAFGGPYHHDAHITRLPSVRLYCSI